MGEATIEIRLMIGKKMIANIYPSLRSSSVITGSLPLTIDAMRPRISTKPEHALITPTMIKPIAGDCSLLLTSFITNSL
jgi:hypothetical protein